jgi:high-affinity iron transporter
MSDLFDAAIATIFAREFLEASIIIGNYRTVILKSENMDEEGKKERLKAVTVATVFATFVAILVVLAVAIPLGVLSNELDKRVTEIIEGISKVVAAVCILQLSLKIPGWLGIYRKVSILPWKEPKPALSNEQKEEELGLSLKEIRFNVAWNIWREVAECGVFLIPFFLDTGAKAIPVSALVGVVIALIIGVGLYVANNRMESKNFLSFFMSGLTLFLSVGLFVGGMHEFEENFPNGETSNVYKVKNDFWNHKRLPMAMLKPFGYSSNRSILQILCFWLWLLLGCTLHFLKYRATKKLVAAEAAQFSAGQKSVEAEVDAEEQNGEAIVQDEQAELQEGPLEMEYKA